MSRSGYSDDCEYIELWRGAVKRAINGKRGQAFLKELATAMDAMPKKRLVANMLVDESSGEVCAIGAVCKARDIDMPQVDVDLTTVWVEHHLNIAYALAAEIEFINDEANFKPETPEERWQRVRMWVGAQIKESENPLNR